MACHFVGRGWHGPSGRFRCCRASTRIFSGASQSIRFPRREPHRASPDRRGRGGIQHQKLRPCTIRQGTTGSFHRMTDAHRLRPAGIGVDFEQTDFARAKRRGRLNQAPAGAHVDDGRGNATHQGARETTPGPPGHHRGPPGARDGDSVSMTRRSIRYCTQPLTTTGWLATVCTGTVASRPSVPRTRNANVSPVGLEDGDRTVSRSPSLSTMITSRTRCRCAAAGLENANR